MYNMFITIVGEKLENYDIEGDLIYMCTNSK